MAAVVTHHPLRKFRSLRPDVWPPGIDSAAPNDPWRGGGVELSLFGFVWWDEPGFVRFADPRAELLFSFFASDAIALLDFSAELVALTR